MGFFAAWGAFFRLAWVGDFLRWCGRGVEDKNHSPSVKRIGFIMAVTVLVLIMVFSAGVMGGLTYAVRAKLAGQELLSTLGLFSDLIKVLAGMVLTAVTSGYLGGIAIERKKEPSDAAPPA